MLLTSARTKRTRLEQELRRSEERLRVTIERAPIGVALVSSEHKWLEANAIACRILGYDRNDLVGRFCPDLTHPEDRARTFEALARLDAGSLSEVIEKRYVRSDGSHVCCRTTVTFLNPSGTEPRYLSIIEDVTDARRTAERLRFQARLLDCVDEAVIATDVDGIVTYWNPFAEQLYGWTAQEAIGRHVADIRPSSIDAETSRRIKDLLRGGESWTGEVILQRRDGTSFVAAVTKSPIIDESGRLIGMVSISRDVSAAKCAEESMRASERKYRELVESAHEGISIVGASGVVLFVNEEMARMVGCTVEELIGSASAEFVHADDRPQLMNLEPFRNRDVRLLRNDGTTVWTSMTRSMLDDRRQLILIADNSARKAAQDALRDREQMLARTEQIAHIGSWELDARSGVRRWSSELFRISGVPEAGGPNLPLLLEHVPADERESVASVNERAFAGERPAVEHRLMNEDGVYRNVLTYGDVVRDEAGNPQRIIGFIHDITDRKVAEARMRRDSIRQEAVAELSAAALAGGSLQHFLEKAVEVVANVLHADRVEMFEHLRGDQYSVRAVRNWPGIAQGTTLAFHADSGLAYVSRTGRSCLVDDVLTESRFSAYSPFVADGIRSGVSTAIVTGSDVASGVLAAQSMRPNAFDNDDRNFLRTVGNVVGQAYARESADAVLLSIAERQIALAAFTREALSGVTDDVLQHAVRIVADHLGARCTLIPVDAADESHAFRAGRAVVDDAATAPHLLDALASDDVVVVDDDGVSGICLAVRSKETRFAVIGAFAAPGRAFRDRDVQFLQAVANTVAEAMARDEAQRALAVSEERYRAVVEGATEIIYTVDGEGKLTSVNAAWQRVTGRSAREVIGRSFAGCVAPSHQERALDAFLAMMRGARIDDVEVDVAGANGEPMTLRISVAPMVKNGVIVGGQGFARDVTATKRAEAERERLESQLQQASRLTSVGRLAATMAHEFNNVLMGISPFVEILQRPNVNDERRTASLDHIRTAMQRGKRVTEEILRFTRQAAPVIDRVELEEFARSLGAEFRSSLSPCHPIEVRLEDPRLAAIADANQLHQILQNLVVNARDAMPDGGPIAISFRRPKPNQRFAFGVVSRPERYVHIRVSDRGCGMSAETRQHIFEPLFTTKRNGTGLGLAVTHQVVAQHGGEIFVESTPGAGSTFHIFIPAAADCAATNAADAPARRDNVPERVLLVEDDAIVASGISGMLEAIGANVRVLNNGRAVMPAIALESPDVVVLDIGLPDVDGVTVYGEIAEEYPALPVILSTGHGDERTVESFRGRTNVTMLLKPYTTDTLLQTISQLKGSNEGISIRRPLP